MTPLEFTLTAAGGILIGFGIGGFGRKPLFW